MPTTERVVSRYLEAAAAPSLMTYALPLTRVVDDALRTIKTEAAQDAFRKGDMKAPAGGVCYFLVSLVGGRAMGQKLWNLLDSSAGLSADKKWEDVAQRVAGHIRGTPAERKVLAAAVGCALLWRTKQATKAQRAAAILEADLKDELEAMGPAATDVEVKKTTPTDRFLEHLTPEVRAYAAQVADTIKKDPSIAAQLVWLALEDANAHDLSSTAESILSPLVKGELPEGGPRPSSIAAKFDWGIEPIAAFGVALMEAVGEGGAARKLIPAFTKDLAPYLTGGL